MLFKKWILHNSLACHLFFKGSHHLLPIRFLNKEESPYWLSCHESIQNGCRVFQLHSASGAPPPGTKRSLSFPRSTKWKRCVYSPWPPRRKMQCEKQQKIYLKKNRNAADLWKWYGAKASCHLYCTVRHLMDKANLFVYPTIIPIGYPEEQFLSAF
ncbi:hypothetical protein CDAR_375031 [Caerostris darwini]|uniref:Uncharacterized protein n=1 Tax=Caerostris darwini TaxID=1538125 RepID=A0AAV4RQC8_9ARAC|nr:hypothetical protein CDAR_375031 [Caerostris darwini]